MNYRLSIDRIEYVIPKKKQTIESVSAISGISVKELDEHLGFVEKYITTDEETLLDLAEEAVYKLMNASRIPPNAIDYIIFAHSGICENGQIRSLSAKIQKLIQASKAFCFEITNGCNSVNAALHVANSLLSNSNAKSNILIVISDTLSKYIDFSKENVMHFYMYSDGAAAILVNNYGEANKLVSSALYTDGRYSEISKIKYKVKIVDNTINQMKEIIIPVMEVNISKELKLRLFDELVSNYIKVINDCIKRHELKTSDIKFLFIAQNSKRVLSDILRYFNFGSERTFFTGKHLGHVGPLDSIIAFHDCLLSGNISSGDYVILAGTGVGFHWGAHLIRA